MKKLVLIAVLLMMTNVAFANENTEVKCVDKEKLEASLYYTTILTKDGDPGTLFKEAIEKVNGIATKNKWQDFKITSKNISLDYGYGRTMTASISINIELDNNYAAITQLFQESDSDSLSFYIQIYQECE
jgi:hypothetical protein